MRIIHLVRDGEHLLVWNGLRDGSLGAEATELKKKWKRVRDSGEVLRWPSCAPTSEVHSVLEVHLEVLVAQGIDYRGIYVTCSKM